MLGTERDPHATDNDLLDAARQRRHSVRKPCRLPGLNQMWRKSYIFRGVDMSFLVAVAIGVGLAAANVTIVLLTGIGEG